VVSEVLVVAEAVDHLQDLTLMILKYRALLVVLVL
jgi:hypothetical protein